MSNRENRIRTCDPLVPNQVLYQAELFPDNAPSRSRTYNLLIRSQTLYPIALWVQIMIMPRIGLTKHTLGTVLGKRKTGFEPATPTMAR
jgi:hypothetical protein